MIIDAHLHIDLNNEGPKPEEFPSLITAAGKVGIEKFCILGEEDVILPLMERYPEQVIGLLHVDPRGEEDTLARIKYCLGEKGMAGIKVTGGGDKACKATDPAFQPVMELLSEMGGYVLMHAWDKTTGNLKYESTPADVAWLARKFPEVDIQMAHLYGAGVKGIYEIAPCDNVYVDTSGSFPETGVLEWAVNVIGPERIVFGTDVPIRDFPVQLAKVTAADIPEEHKQMILSENIMRLIKTQS